MVDMISSVESDWWFSECGKIAKSSEREKWKIIDRLTNQSNFNEVQPIRKVENGKSSFLFSDDDILKEKPHIVMLLTTAYKHQLII